MALIEHIVHSCPYCGLVDNLKQFLGWEQNQKQGYQGRTPEGIILLLCPQCENRIRFSIQDNEFLKEFPSNPISTRHIFVPILLIFLCLVAVGLVMFKLDGGWNYLVSGLLLAYGASLIRGICGYEKPPNRLSDHNQSFYKKTTKTLRK
jgi:hypothetical protein